MGRLYTFDAFLKAASTIQDVKINKDFGCVMLELKIDGWKDILGKIDEADLQEEKGLETEPHVTVLYGIHDWDEPKEKVKELVLQFKRPVVELTGVSIFENEKFDVVKIDVKSKDLAAMNAKLTSDLQCTVKFPDYHAHATIAYVKPGCGKKYKGMEIKLPEDEIILSKVLYSMSDKKKITYDMPDEQGE